MKHVGWRDTAMAQPDMRDPQTRLRQLAAQLAICRSWLSPFRCAPVTSAGKCGWFHGWCSPSLDESWVVLKQRLGVGYLVEISVGRLRGSTPPHPAKLVEGSESLPILRRRTSNTSTNESTSARLLPQIAPLRPNIQVAGMPISKDSPVASEKAIKTEAGDSIALNAIAGPYAALQTIDPKATTGRRCTTSM